MNRATSKKMKHTVIAAAICAALCLPSVQAAGFAKAPKFSADADSSLLKLGKWHGYAKRGLLPSFSWVEPEGLQDSAPHILDGSYSSGGRVFSLAAISEASAIAVDFNHSSVGGLASLSQFTAAIPATENGAALQQISLIPTLFQEVGDSVFAVSVIFSNQRFSAFNVGSDWEQGDGNNEVSPALAESSKGAGVRIGVTAPVFKHTAVTLSLQSKVDMNPLQTYRGVFSEPGDFDVPAVAALAVEWQLLPVASVVAGVDRVMFSEVQPFTSSALPTRFLALLGDGGSPVFAWRDLTVYSLGFRIAPTTNDQIFMRYSSHLQPEPTSELLLGVLESYYDDRSFSVDYQRTTKLGRFRFAVSYAPTQYILGNSPISDADIESSSTEFWASYRFNF